MKTTAPRGSENDELSALIETLHETEERLEELTAGEVDTVSDREGRTFLLRRAQEQLRHNEATRQAALLNALPAHIALIDPRGVIISVNETWRRFAGGAVQGPGHRIGVNYIEICERARGEGFADASYVAQGIRDVLAQHKKSFSIEYPCHSPAEQRWFLLTVTPLSADRAGVAIVMHVEVTAEKQAEESLRDSELRFRQMADHIRDVFFLQDLDSTNLYFVNAAYERIWGRTRESLYADPTSWAKAIHPDDANYALTQFTRGRDDGFDYEFRIIRPDGGVRWLHARGFPILDPAGKPYRTAGVISDITERKLASDDLLESQRRFSHLLGNVEMISLMLDTNARITYCNDYLLRLTGWRREEVIGGDWFELFIPEGPNELKSLFTDVLADTPSASHHENEILTRSGFKRLIQWNNTTLRSGSGEVIGTASIGLDITESKQAEARLRLQSAALNAADHAMLITDRDLSIVWINPAFTELTGYTENDALGRLPQDLLRSGVHDDAFYQSIQETIFAGESWRGEITNRRKDGTLYPEASIITPVKDEDGTISHFISIKADLTSQRELEGQLRQAQKMEAVGQLAGGVAHEFNNLLQALMSMAAIMRLRAGNSAISEIGTEMELQIKRGASLTQQLLLFSQRQLIEKADLDLGEQVQKAGVLLRRLIPENIRMVVEVPPQRLSIKGDAGQIQQILLNFAINARDAMQGGGTLSLRAGSIGTDFFLEVEDTGHGMDEETRARIFEPFFTTKELGKGTGLGLAAVYGIVEQHHGRFDVQSHPGRGSRFRVLLPPTQYAPSATTPKPGEETEEVPRGSGRVLLVEDEEAVRGGIALLLEMIGYDVIPVVSGEDAMATPREPIPDLLLSDVTLPGIAGMALGERLLERWPALKIVLMSGYVEQALRADAIERGWHFLQKPFEMADLAKQLRAALKEKAIGPTPLSEAAPVKS